MSFQQPIFITGTDTDIGKTFVAAIMMAGLQGTYWKPIQSGLTTTTDTEWIQQITQLGSQHFLPEKYRLTQPLSPHAAAKIDQVQIIMEDLQIPPYPANSQLIIEGAGGIMVPLNEKLLMIDLIQFLNIPVLIVARSLLGTINHTLLTIDKLRSYKIPIIGVVLNGVKNLSNKKAIEKYGNINVIAEIEPILKQDLNAQKLQDIFKTQFKKTATFL